jgi:aminoglycoside 6'-N-acetyltransferase I
MDIRACTGDDINDWTALRIALWPDESPEDLRDGAAALLSRDDAVNLVCRTAEGEAIGFAEAVLRRDYVNGCETSPVAFLEGIYVMPGHRREGIARELCDRVLDWARRLGCTEFASDALLENAASHAFHAAIGFEETERVVYFRRAL